MPGKRSPDVIQVNLRLSKELHNRLRTAADERDDLSLNAEMVDRLVRTFRREKVDAILERAQRLVDEAVDDAIRIQRECSSKIDGIERDLRAGVPIDEVFPRNRLLARMKK